MILPVVSKGNKHYCYPIPLDNFSSGPGRTFPGGVDSGDVASRPPEAARITINWKNFWQVDGNWDLKTAELL